MPLSQQDYQQKEKLNVSESNPTKKLWLGVLIGFLIGGIFFFGFNLALKENSTEDKSEIISKKLTEKEGSAETKEDVLIKKEVNKSKYVVFETSKYLPINAENIKVKTGDINGDNYDDILVYYEFFDRSLVDKISEKGDIKPNKYYLETYLYSSKKEIYKQKRKDEGVLNWLYITKYEFFDANQDGKQEILVIKSVDGTGGIIKWYVMYYKDGEIIDAKINKDLPKSLAEKNKGHEWVDIDKDNKLILSFPLYEEEDANCCPLGGYIKAIYDLDIVTGAMKFDTKKYFYYREKDGAGVKFSFLNEKENFMTAEIVKKFIDLKEGIINIPYCFLCNDIRYKLDGEYRDDDYIYKCPQADLKRYKILEGYLTLNLNDHNLPINKILSIVASQNTKHIAYVTDEDKLFIYNIETKETREINIPTDVSEIKVNDTYTQFFAKVSHFSQKGRFLYFSLLKRGITYLYDNYSNKLFESDAQSVPYGNNEEYIISLDSYEPIIIRNVDTGEVEIIANLNHEYGYILEKIEDDILYTIKYSVTDDEYRDYHEEEQQINLSKIKIIPISEEIDLLKNQIENWDLYKEVENKKDKWVGTDFCGNKEFMDVLIRSKSGSMKILKLNEELDLVITPNYENWTVEKFIAFNQDPTAICSAGGRYPKYAYSDKLVWVGVCTTGFSPEVTSSIYKEWEEKQIRCEKARKAVKIFFEEK